MEEGMDITQAVKTFSVLQPKSIHTLFILVTPQAISALLIFSNLEPSLQCQLGWALACHTHPFTLKADSHLFMLFHGGIQFLRQVIRHIGHTRFLLIAPAQAAFVFAGFLVILLLSIFAVSFCYLYGSTKNK